MRSHSEQWDKLYLACNTQRELSLVYMWVKAGIIDKNTFIGMVNFIFNPPQ